MATTGKINTTLLAVYVGGTKINHAQGGSLNIDHSPRDVTTKDSAGWQEVLEGLRSWSVSANGLLAFDATYGTDDLDDIITGRTTVTVRFSTEVTGDTYYEGTAYISNLACDSPGQEETATWSCEFAGTGALTVGAVA
jgi:predicted secreted protein